MLLTEFVRAYGESRDIRQSTIDQLRYAVGSIEKHYVRILRTRDFSQPLINGWIAAKLEAGYARKTVAVQRGALLTLWKAAHDDGLAPALQKVRMVRVPDPIPQAWQPDEFKAILAEAEKLPGAFPCGVPRRLMVKALALVGYYTGLRPSDLLALRSIDVLTDSSVVVRQSKTSEPIKITLPDDAMQAVLATQPEQRERLFPISRKTVWYWFRKIRAGKGSPKWLRRTGATQVEIQQPGGAMAYLGHKTPGLAYKHYVDLRQVATTKPIPPSPTG